MSKISLFLCCMVAGVSVCRAETEKLVEHFDEARPANWGVNFGVWEVADGNLVCRQVAADKHAAASRWKIPMQDGVIEVRLKLDGASAFHVGFDPKRGTLKKKGHLYSLIISPAGARIMKHLDKADPNSKNEILAESKVDLSKADWIEVRLEAKGNEVLASVGEGIKLTASDPSFGVPKPGIVFRCVGETAYLDQVAVMVKK